LSVPSEGIIPELEICPHCGDQGLQVLLGIYSCITCSHIFNDFVKENEYEKRYREHMHTSIHMWDWMF